MDKDSISSQGAHARPYLGHSHSISMLEYAQINMSQCGDGTNWWHLKIYSIVHMCPVIQSLSHPHHFLFFFLMSFRYGRSTHGNGQGLRKPRSRIGKTSHVMPKAAILLGSSPTVTLKFWLHHLTQELHSPSSTLVWARARPNERTWGVFSMAVPTFSRGRRGD